ncbi:MAG: DUF3150 domain-containing protein [Lentisphaerae bacterium]|nr:DUF3150 domain-containing protein [Lentisphaerota bacterium]
MSNPTMLDVLTREGVLINVSVRYWRAAKKLKAEDLGLDPDDVTDKLISLGHKKLLPREALAAFALIESRAHALVDASTFPFLGVAHFLPNAKLAEVTTRLEALEQEFQAAQQTFMGQYRDLRVQASRDWWDAARKLVSDPDRLVATIEASFPKPDTMGRYFQFSTHLFQVSVPDGIAQADLITAADQREIIEARQRAAVEARGKIAQGVDSFVRDCVATLREQTAQLCEDMLASFQQGKTGVHQKTLNRLVGFIDEFKQLNFAGDAELEARLSETRRTLLSRSAGEYRDDTKARLTLTTGIEKLANTARQMAKQDAQEIVQRFGQLGARRFHLAA